MVIFNSQLYVYQRVHHFSGYERSNPDLAGSMVIWGGNHQTTSKFLDRVPIQMMIKFTPRTTCPQVVYWGVWIVFFHPVKCPDFPINTKVIEIAQVGSKPLPQGDEHPYQLFWGSPR
jgi:hypothetical protein